MKKYILKVLFLAAAFGGILIAQEPQSTPTYNWSYWSYELGLGIGLQSINLSDYAKRTLPLDKNDTLAAQIAQNTSIAIIPDFRLGIEKSWQIGSRFTATLDLALLTPAVTFGVLLSPRTRFYVGAHYARGMKDTIPGTGMPDENGIPDLRPIAYVRNPFILSPRVGFDTFLSPSTMLRINLSYDYLALYSDNIPTIQKDAEFACQHWPQITVSIKRFF